MKTEPGVERKRGVVAVSRRGNGDGGAQLVVTLVENRRHHRQRVGCSALKDDDQHLAAGRRKLRRACGRKSIERDSCSETGDPASTAQGRGGHCFWNSGEPSKRPV